MDKMKLKKGMKFVLSTIDHLFLEFDPGHYWLGSPDGQHDLDLGNCTTIHELVDVLFEVYDVCTNDEHTLDGWTLYAMDGDA